MKKIFFRFTICLFLTNNISIAQMINGGFESQDVSAPAGSDYYSIEYATGWHNLLGSCDLIPLVNRPLRTGVGAGSLGATPSGWTEFCYGNTTPLIAGHTYKVTFWVRKDYEPTNGTDINIGLLLSPNIPSTSSLSTTIPTISVNVNSTQWVKAEGCFVASQNAAHFVSIGPFGSSGSPETILVSIDDVEVLDVTDFTFPNASLTIPQNTYCVGDNVIIDGSSSSNEAEYQWKIFLNGVQEVYNSGIITGTASTFDATPHLSFLQPGACYEVELTLYGTCTDVATTTFCFEDPQISFLNTNLTVCGNTPLNLEVTGDNGWTYLWSSGQNGVGLKTAQVIPNPPFALYSVTAITLLGCDVTEYINLTVHDPNNVAPWMDGINGTGEYTIYVNQGQQVSFSSTLYNDHSNEDVLNILTGPSISTLFYSTSYPSNNTGNFIFNFNAGFGLVPDLPEGSYTFIVDTKDLNVCQNKLNQYIFTVNVICENCPICVSYENRSSITTPLPPETKAAKCINAGFSQTVTTENQIVAFQAGETIDLGAFFDAGPGFSAQIEPSTCITDCNDCCVDWEGFSVDQIGNGYYYYLNFDLEEDTDPTNDYFQITDIAHPFCAYGALGYKLSIVDAAQSEFYENTVLNQSCCSFVSPAPENPIPHASIYWDGYTENIFGNMVRPNDGTLYYLLTLYGCNGVEEVIQGFIHVGFIPYTPGMVQNGNSDPINAMYDEKFQTEQKLLLDKLSNEISLNPNPASNEIKISGYNLSIPLSIQLYDEKGLVISKRETLENETYNVSKLASGTYYCRIYTENAYILKKFVKI